MEYSKSNGHIEVSEQPAGPVIKLLGSTRRYQQVEVDDEELVVQETIRFASNLGR